MQRSAPHPTSRLASCPSGSSHRSEPPWSRLKDKKFTGTKTRHATGLPQGTMPSGGGGSQSDLLPGTPNGLELREAALWASCPAARATLHSFSRILAGKARSNFPPASRVRCSESII